MTDPLTDLNLELACAVGSYENAIEAITEGADVECKSGAPLFLSIQNRHRQLIAFLLDHGADPSPFLSKKRLKEIHSREDLIEELIACVPYNPRDIKLDELQEIDSAIRTDGVEFLVAEMDWDHATRFRDSLNAIGASSTHRCIAEFLQWARSESGGSTAIPSFLRCNDDVVSEYRSRYLSTGENLIALANDFLNVGDEECD